MSDDSPTTPAAGAESGGTPSVSISGDLAGGSLTPGDSGSINSQLADSAARRKMRWIAFWGFGILCILFLILLGCALFHLFRDPKTQAVLGHVANWHFITLLVVALVIFAAVPLSLSIALMKMIGGSDASGDKGLSVTTPQLELFKLFVETIKTFKVG